MPDIEGNLTPDEELEAQFQPEGEQEQEQEEAPAEEETSEAPAKVKIGDAEYEASELQSLIEFQQWAQANQDKMQHFADYVRGEADFVPKGQEQQSQGEEDPYDLIADEKLRESLRAQRDELAQLKDVTSRQVTAASLDEANRAVNEAYEEIKTRYGLDENAVKELAEETAKSGVLPGIRARISDAREAAIQAMDTTYWSTPAYREKAIEAEINRLSDHERRKALAGSIGGNAGSLSRELPSDEQVAKMTKQERLDAMAAEIAASVRGTT